MPSILKSLSKADRVLAEWHRRHRERALERFNPTDPRNNGKQAEFLASTAKIRCYIGANGTGKTTVGMAEAVSYALGYRPWDGSTTTLPPSRVLVVCQDFTNATKEDVMPVLEQFLPESMILHVDRLANGMKHKWTLKNGSIIKLQSYEQDPFAFEGASWDFVLFNEPAPRDIYVAVLRGIAKRNGRVALTFTPIGLESAWIYDDIYTKADGKRISVVTAEQGDSFMDEEAREMFNAALDEEEKEARVYGKFRHLQGRVYRDFDAGVHVIPRERIEALIADPNIPKGVVVDPHDRRPFAIAWFLVTPQDEMVFFDEHPEGEFHKMKSSRWSLDDYASILAERERRYSPVLWSLMDPNFGISPKVVSKSLVDEFAERGLIFDTNIKDAVQEGHIAVANKMRYDRNRVIDAANKPSLYFCANCTNLIAAMTRYAWIDNKSAAERGFKEKPRELFKDFADCVRYAVMYGPTYVNPQEMFKPRPGPRVAGVM